MNCINDQIDRLLNPRYRPLLLDGLYKDIMIK